MQLSQAVRICDSLRGTYIRRHTPDSLRELMRPLLTQYNIYGIGRSAHQTWWRARRCESKSRFDNLHKVIYPPREETRWNRANTPDSPTLYASWNIATALDEIAAKPCDIVQLIGLRVRHPIDLPCAIVGEYQSIHNSGGSLVNSRKLEDSISRLLLNSTQESVQLQLFLDSFFAELLRAQPKKPEDYLPTAILAEHLLSHAKGLLFPSVETAHAVNLAVRAPVFDEAFEVMCTFVCRIDRCHGYGVYDAELVENSSTFSSDGTIHWDSHRSLPSVFSYQSGYGFSIETSGWRVPIAA